MCKKASCQNCGQCCGPVVIGRIEKEAIRKFLLKHPDIAKKAQSKTLSNNLNDTSNLICVFRDNEAKSCMIYPVRPFICKSYTCKFPEWKSELSKLSSRDSRNYCAVINEVFGNPNLREQYIALHNHYFPHMKVLRKL